MVTTDNRPPVVIGTIDVIVPEDRAAFSFYANSNAYDPDLMGAAFAVNIPLELPPGLTWDRLFNVFTLDPSAAVFQSLAAGQTLSFSVSYMISDFTYLVPDTLNVTVVGVNDQAVVGGVAQGSVTEDSGLAATGLLSVTDVDNGEAGFVAGILNGAYGSLTLNAAGAWSYSLNNSLAAVQALGAGDTLTDTVTVLTIDGTASQISLTINGAIEPVITGTASGNTLNGAAQGEQILGLAGNDTLKGNGGADTLDGGSGADRLTGGLGADVLIGGAGSDRFIFISATESAPAAADQIMDFVRGSDKIDLTAIDAVAGGSNNAFRWIGANGFTAAGQVHYSAATGLLQADVNGDRIADLQIQLTPGLALTSADILL